MRMPKWVHKTGSVLQGLVFKKEAQSGQHPAAHAGASVEQHVSRTSASGEHPVLGSGSAVRKIEPIFLFGHSVKTMIPKEAKEIAEFTARFSKNLDADFFVKGQVEFADLKFIAEHPLAVVSVAKLFKKPEKVSPEKYEMQISEQLLRVFRQTAHNLLQDARRSGKNNIEQLREFQEVASLLDHIKSSSPAHRK
ncbi:MAG: hypothetical protein COV47_03710 [Candidatus Diapherotrites archaeon CG11_big_fil_rev_8_21_14_0_20_37_9]|nr:MAG: hypothetical protein COV47_03710 [Candidatus Diapherotrites archaeon CG11_big_fil_rev_8_21_14_0_20_37_9]